MPFSNLAVYPLFANSPVMLHPSQGCYQKPLSATVTKITPKRIFVKSHNQSFTFLKDGQPYGKTNTDFPRYVLKLT